jgi:hypothetical protein
LFFIAILLAGGGQPTEITATREALVLGLVAAAKKKQTE